MEQQRNFEVPTGVAPLFASKRPAIKEWNDFNLLAKLGWQHPGLFITDITYQEGCTQMCGEDAAEKHGWSNQRMTNRKSMQAVMRLSEIRSRLGSIQHGGDSIHGLCAALKAVKAPAALGSK